VAIEEPVRAPELEEAGQAYEDGRRGDIRAPMLQFYREAIEREDHYNASQAAHYLGLRGVSETVEERIQWHLRSEEHAKAVPPSQPQESFASIYRVIAQGAHGTTGAASRLDRPRASTLLHPSAGVRRRIPEADGSQWRRSSSGTVAARGC
jgi:hypothetical protein